MNLYKNKHLLLIKNTRKILSVTHLIKSFENEAFRVIFMTFFLEFQVFLLCFIERYFYSSQKELGQKKLRNSTEDAFFPTPLLYIENKMIYFWSQLVYKTTTQDIYIHSFLQQISRPHPVSWDNIFMNILALYIYFMVNSP